MGFRFQKRVKILPGVRVNLSKSGASLSLGGRGGSVNLSERGVRTTVGLPGTGMSWSSQRRWTAPAPGAVRDGVERVLFDIGERLDALARNFNALSPRINQISAAWNAERRTLDENPGLRSIFLPALVERHKATLAGYRAVEDQLNVLAVQLDDLQARLAELHLGFLAPRAQRRARAELLALVGEHRIGSARLTAAIARVRGEVNSELAETLLPG